MAANTEDMLDKIRFERRKNFKDTAPWALTSLISTANIGVLGWNVINTKLAANVMVGLLVNLNLTSQKVTDAVSKVLSQGLDTLHSTEPAQLLVGVGCLAIAGISAVPTLKGIGYDMYLRTQSRGLKEQADQSNAAQGEAAPIPDFSHAQPLTPPPSAPSLTPQESTITYP